MSCPSLLKDLHAKSSPHIHLLTIIDLDDNALPGFWTFAEMATMVITACLPSIKPLFDKKPWFQRLFPDVPDLDKLDQNQLPTLPYDCPVHTMFSRNGSIGRLSSDRRQGRFFDIRGGKIVIVDENFGGKFCVDLLDESIEGNGGAVKVICNVRLPMRVKISGDKVLQILPWELPRRSEEIIEYRYVDRETT